MNVNVILSPDDFAQDLDLHLGRANGNVYHRREGVEGVHDGQYMIRLKKKRFVILDYSIVPTDADYQAAAVSPHIHIPDGAGRQQCTSTECAKVGVPVCLYDSVPDDTLPLYLRSGLCFSCQRHLNEKRRTVRKRKSDTGAGPEHVFTVASSKKKFKLGGNPIDLAADAIIVNGPVDGARPHGPGYGYSEIGDDLVTTLREITHNSNRLLAASGQTIEGVDDDEHNEAVDISALYETAFKSASKGLYLLSQWKMSWDTAVAAAVAQDTTVQDEAGYADAVASAAAVAAAADQNATNMVSLLLAAEKKEGSKSDKKEVVGV